MKSTLNSTTKTSNQVSTVVFVDAGVENYQQLVNGVIPTAEVLVLDVAADGIEQISQVLQQRQDVGAVHIVSHGAPGCLYLGNTQLSLDTLDKYSRKLQQWFALGWSASPRLFLYGCQVAAGDAGAEFLAKLRALTGANIAASANLTGNAALGGDWELEVTLGKGEFASVFAPQIMEIYPAVLNLLTNPGAETGNMSGWTILENGGNGWAVQPGGYEGSQTFVTSYGWGKRSQTVDLVAKGYSTAVLDQAPTINISEWFRGIGGNTADLSYLKVELRGASGNVIASFNSGNLTANSNWQQISHTFTNYGAGVRYVYWEDGGKDVEYWAGHYGTQFDGASLTLGSPSNSAPIDLSLSASNIDENAAASTIVGTFSTTDPDVGNRFTYSLVSGIGSTDNSVFSIVGNQLRINASPDFETKNNYSIRVRTTDQGGLSYEKVVSVNVNDVNEQPTDISLSNTSINENVPANTIVGTFSTTDPDVGNRFTYSLVSGTGSTDNSVFSIVGDQLRINASPDFETKNNYSIRVRTTDQGGLSYEKVVTVNVNDLNNEAPILIGAPQIIRDIAPQSSSANPANLTRINNTLYFTANEGIHGTELWRSNGNFGTTMLVKDIALGSASANPTNLTVVDNILYFTANNGVNGTALWKSDGSEAGTVMVKPIPSGGSNLSNLTNLNGTLYFTVNDGVNGTELWKSDGTEAGTVLLKDIRVGGSSFPAKLIAIDGTLYFTADDGVNGRELWKSDGTAAGTVIVKDITPGSGGSFPYHLTNINGTLYFTADDGANGVELWKSDGTPAGTVQVKDIFAGSIGSNPSNLTDVNGILYFTANDGVNGGELWKSDGTPAGTVLVKDIVPGSDTSNIFNLTNVNGTLFFTTNDGVNGEELWKSDGTPAGTVLVKDIRSGSSGSNPSNLTNINGILYFTADDGNNGRELWKSDGTQAGTVLVQDIVPGIDGSGLRNLTNVNGIPYFTANNGTSGIELQHLSSGLANQTILQGTPLSIPFVVSDGESPASQLTVTATSSDPNLVPETNLVITGSDSNRTLILTPMAGQVGSATITVNVSDGVNTISIPFDVTVASTLLALEATNIRQFEGYSGTTPYTFTITRTGDLGGTSTVNYAVIGSGLHLADANDFGGILPSGTVTFAPGETTQTITINVSGDAAIEPDEDFTLTLSNPTNGLITTATTSGTILDDDPAPALAISRSNITQREGNRDETTFVFNVTRTGNLRQASTVDYTVVGSGVNPANGDDFVGGILPSGTVTFVPGEAVKAISVKVVGDKTLEGDETFTITLSNPTGGATITTATASDTILDDDTPYVTLSLSSTQIDENGSSVILTASLDQTSSEDVTINLGLFGGKAQQGTDYTVATSLVIPAGQTSATTELRANDDNWVEGDETFSIDIVSLVNGRAAGGVQRVNGTLIDNDYPDVSITATSSSVTEDGSANLVYTVTRSVATDQPLTVNYTVGGSATQGVDYANILNSVVIPAGKTSVTITIDPTSDRVAEPNETVVLTLEPGAKYNLGGSTSAIGTIRDDDPVRINIADTQVIEGTGGTKLARLDINLSNPSFRPITINYTTANGTADTSDYTPTSGFLTIPGDGVTTKGTIEIPLTTDNRFENNENFFVNLTNATSDVAVNLGKSRGTVTILNDDQPPPPDTKDIKLEGNFSYVNNDYSSLVSNGGTVYIGRKSGNNRLIRVEGGTVKYDAAGVTIIDGTVYSQIGGITAPLFKGTTTISFSTGISTSFTDRNLANDLKIAGLNTTFSGIFLDKQEIRLKGDLPLPSGLGGAGLSLSLGTNPTSSNALKITRNGLELGNDLPISNTSINLFGMIPVNVPNFDLTYEKRNDLLKLQGEINLVPFSKLVGSPNLKVDLTDSNFIQIQNAKADLVGKLSLKNLKFSEKWGVDEASITVDTINRKVGGDFGITFPFKGNGVTAKFGADFFYNPLALNRVSGTVPLYPGIPLGKIPLKIVGLGGGVNNISPRAQAALEFSGLIKLEDTPGSGLEIEGTLTVSSEKLTGKAELTYIDEDLLKGEVNLDLNWNQGYFSVGGKYEALNGFLFGDASLKLGNLKTYRWDWSPFRFVEEEFFGFTSGGRMGVRVPRSVRYIGGKTLFSTEYYLSYLKNNNQNDDFAAAWRTVNLLFTDVTVGAKINLNRPWEISLIGSAPSRPVSSFEITSNVNGTNRDWILLAAEWSNPTSDVRVRVKTPDGTWVEEADFINYGFVIVDELSDEDTRIVAIANPTPGIWDIKVVDSTGLGAIEYVASESTIKPTIDITSPTVNVLGGQVNIDFKAYDADSNAEIAFFYDTDGEGYDGFQLPGTVLEADGIGTYLWNTQGIAPRDYFIYAMIQDGVNQPIFSDYAQGSIKVEELANLTVDTNINKPLVRPGEEVTYTITVTNTEGGTAKDVVLINYIPAGATLVSSSVDFGKLENDEGYGALLGDIAFGETVTIDLTIRTPNQIGDITNIARVITNTYDPEVFDDVSVLVSTVDTFKAEPTLVDLSVEATTNVLLPNPGEDFTLSFTVFNNSRTNATGVTLVGNLATSLSNFVPSLGSIDTNNVLTVNLGDIEAGGSKTVTVQTKAPNTASIFNVLDVRANEDDLDLIDNLVTQDVFFANNAPVVAISLSNSTSSLAENTNTTNRVKVADIAITNNASGINNLSLSGTDTNSFEIVGNELYLKAGTVLDYETKKTYNVTVAVDDPTVGSTPDATTAYTLELTDVNEAPNPLPTQTRKWDFVTRDYNLDGATDIVAIKKSDTGSGRTEVHIMNRANNYQSWLLQTGTVLHETDNTWDFLKGDYNRDGATDILSVKKSGTGSGRTEVHIMDAANNYQSWLLHTATALHETDDNWDFQVGDYNRDGAIDILGIKKSSTGSARTEVHILDGASNYQSWLLHTTTALHETGDNWDFQVGDYNRDGAIDILSVKKSGTGSGRTEVHILDGTSNYQSWLLHTATALHEIADNWRFLMDDYSRNNAMGIISLKESNTGSRTAEAHIFNGGTNYQNWLLQTASVLPEIRDSSFV